jgi:acetyl esterase/lipase
MLIQGVNSSVALALLRQLPALRKSPTPNPLEINALRTQSKVLNEYLTRQFGVSPDVTFTDQFISTSAGQLRLRTYTPGEISTDSIIYYVHGGGYILCTVEDYEARCAHWAANTGSVVVCVDYRLSPEHPYPAPLDDVMSGLTWLSGNLDKFGASKIIIAGDSAGGGLAAAAVLRNRDTTKIDICAQILIYPMLDDRNLGPDSRFTGPFITWGFLYNSFAWKAYLQDQPANSNPPIYAAPARAQDLKGLPPTYIDMGTKDIFLDEDTAYAKTLIAAGVPVDAHMWNGVPHGFDYFAPKTSIAQKAWQARFDFARMHL